VTVSAGATGSFHCACLALLNPGDEVILFEPYYQYHISALLAVEAVPVTVKMQAPDWTFSVADIERMITPRTKAIIVNSPGNPSGKCSAGKNWRVLQRSHNNRICSCSPTKSTSTFCMTVGHM